ncbi:MAG: hypothetical protein KGK30_05940, partial [Elusimicrobia bacterium]|nr:hypothetical protein [Elusimicrobiota bacterium]
ASGCLGYPRPYLRTISGKALLDNGQPLKIGAAIVKDCDSINGETEERGRMRTTTTDKDGRYSLTVIGLAWNYKNFVTLSECTSHVQRFVCRPYCKQADAIDIDILGK